MCTDSSFSLSEPHFISYFKPALCVETLTRWKSKFAQQLLGEKHPGASFADIPVLSRVLLLFNVNLHSFSLYLCFSHFKAVKEEPISLIQCKYLPSFSALHSNIVLLGHFCIIAGEFTASPKFHLFPSFCKNSEM